MDKETDLRYHRPNLSKKGVSWTFSKLLHETAIKFVKLSFSAQEDKKMIRYRDGKIVSTKGERFSQVANLEHVVNPSKLSSFFFQLLTILKTLHTLPTPENILNFVNS